MVVMALRDETRHLLGAVRLARLEGEIVRIATEMVSVELIYQRESAYNDLVKIDSEIPGLGLHNVNELGEGGWPTGVYRIEDRPLFRGIQFVGSYLSNIGRERLARAIVYEACYHVERSLKWRLGVDEDLSISGILDHSGARSLESDLPAVLRDLNKLVYANPKRTIEVQEWDADEFSVADALAIYLVCRELGARILRDSGITTEHGNPVFRDEAAVAR